MKRRTATSWRFAPVIVATLCMATLNAKVGAAAEL